MTTCTQVLPSAPATLAFSDIARAFGCYSGYSITANITVVTIGNTILFTVTSPGTVESLEYEIVTYSEITITTTTTSTTTGPPGNLNITPTMSERTITLALGQQTTTGFFTVTNMASSVKLVSIAVSKPQGSTVTVSIVSFSLSQNQQQLVSFSCMSPPTHTGTAWQYQLTAVESGFTGTNPMHTHRQVY